MISGTTMKRLALAIGCAGAFWAFTAWVGLRPRPLLLVLSVIAAFACVWALGDVAADRYVLDLAAPRRRLIPRYGLDARFSRLSASFRPPYDPHIVAGQAHTTLVAVVDERLLARHGIDRAKDPDRARAVMDPVLAAYVERPPGPRRHLIAYLSDMVTRIEAL